MFSRDPCSTASAFYLPSPPSFTCDARSFPRRSLRLRRPIVLSDSSLTLISLRTHALSLLAPILLLADIVLACNASGIAPSIAQNGANACRLFSLGVLRLNLVYTCWHSRQ